jgi:4'-phosphopantetheinyl transferase
MRKRFVVVRHALRCLLGERLGLLAREVDLGTTNNGRPVLLSGAEKGVHFSVTHAATASFVAIASGPVGIDAETVRPHDWNRPAAELVLSPAELAWLDAQPDPDTSFCRAWTRKEAFAKFDGRGLSRDLRGITLTPTPRCGSISSVVSIIDLHGGYDTVLAVATAHGPLPAAAESAARPRRAEWQSR